MHLDSHRVRDFRNLEQASLELAPGINLLFGENGQGKTNLLESVWFVATQRPLRASRLVELVRFGKESAEVEARVRDQVTTRLLVNVEAGRKRARVDGKSAASIEAWSEHLKVVAFTPDDLDISKGGPGARRRWLDRVAFGRFPAHLEVHRRYARALKARNRLLKEGGGRVAGGPLEAFDEELARTGAALLDRRLRALGELREGIDALYPQVTGTALELGLRYESEALGERPVAGEDLGGLEDRLRESLRRHLPRDLARGHTSCGPHADDLALTLDGRPVRTYGSQGQQRAVVLVLKIAEIENLRARLHRMPLLLLDDVSSELDPERNAHLLAYLGAYQGQVLLTTTDPSLAPVPASAAVRRWRVEDGRIEPAE